MGSQSLKGYDTAMKLLFATLLLVMLSSQFTNAEIFLGKLDGIPRNNADLERLAFQHCNTDSMDGLSWAEVKACEDKYCASMGIANCPTKEDFDHFDVDKDGILTWQEWESTQ